MEIFKYFKQFLDRLSCQPEGFRLEFHNYREVKHFELSEGKREGEKRGGRDVKRDRVREGGEKICPLIVVMNCPPSHSFSTPIASD